VRVVSCRVWRPRQRRRRRPNNNNSSNNSNSNSNVPSHLLGNAHEAMREYGELDGIFAGLVDFDGLHVQERDGHIAVCVDARRASCGSMGRVPRARSCERFRSRILSDNVVRTHLAPPRWC